MKVIVETKDGTYRVFADQYEIHAIERLGYTQTTRLDIHSNNQETNSVLAAFRKFRTKAECR